MKLLLLVISFPYTLKYAGKNDGSYYKTFVPTVIKERISVDSQVTLNYLYNGLNYNFFC